MTLRLLPTLLLTLLYVASAGAAQAPADSLKVIPGPGARLSRVLATQAGDGSWLWPVARMERSALLVEIKYTRAALRDTVSALNAAHRADVAQVTAERDSARTEVEHLQKVANWAEETRPGWFDRFWAKWGGPLCAALGIFIGHMAGGG